MIYRAFFCGHACVCMLGERAMEYGLSRLTPEQSVGRHCGILA